MTALRPCNRNCPPGHVQGDPECETCDRLLRKPPFVLSGGNSDRPLAIRYLLIGGPSHGQAVSILQGRKIIIHADSGCYEYNCNRFACEEKIYPVAFHGMASLSAETFKPLAEAVNLRPVS